MPVAGGRKIGKEMRPGLTAGVDRTASAYCAPALIGGRSAGQRATPRRTLARTFQRAEARILPELHDEEGVRATVRASLGSEQADALRRLKFTSGRVGLRGRLGTVGQHRLRQWRKRPLEAREPLDRQTAILYN
jgi:hypothetical protein